MSGGSSRRDGTAGSEEASPAGWQAQARVSAAGAPTHPPVVADEVAAREAGEAGDEGNVGHGQEEQLARRGRAGVPGEA